MQLRAPCWVPPESRAMDFDLNDHQRRRLEAVGSLIDDSGAAADAEKLDKALLASDFHRGATVLERFLIAEALARRGVGCGYGLYCLLSDLLPTDLPTGLVAITEANRSGPVRFADTAAVVVQLHAEQATIHGHRPRFAKLGNSQPWRGTRPSRPLARPRDSTWQGLINSYY